jgi:hypothetical protein
MCYTIVWFSEIYFMDPIKITGSPDASVSGKSPAQSAAGFWILTAAVVAAIAFGGILVS